MVKYWADAINNANTVATILKVQDWMTAMAETIQKAKEATAAQLVSQAPPLPLLQVHKMTNLKSKWALLPFLASMMMNHKR